LSTFDLNIFQLLIILGSIQGLVYAIILFIRKKFRIASNIFLGLMVFFVALCNIQHILIDMDYLSETNVFRKMYFPVQWLIMPMFYFHVHHVIFNKNPKQLTKFFLIAPSVLITLVHVAHFFYYKFNLSVAAIPDYHENGLLLYINFASFVFHGAILYFTFKMLQKNSELSKANFGKKSANAMYKQQMWYMKLIISFVVIISVGLLVTFSLIQFDINHRSLLYVIFLLVSFAGYYLGYVGVYRSTLRPNSKLLKPTVKNSLATYKRIHEHIIKEKVYLNINLSLSEIAKKFNISSGYLSQLINTHSGQNFSDYINELRINSSKIMLLEHQFQQYTVESIGLECGFKSKSNFYSAFKKFTGQTPTEFVKKQGIRPES